MMLVCKKCGKFFHPKRNGVVVEEGMPMGLAHNGQPVWTPYKLWMADSVECKKCGTEVIGGFAPQPFLEHYQKPHYEDYKKAFGKPYVFVEDCI